MKENVSSAGAWLLRAACLSVLMTVAGIASHAQVGTPPSSDGASASPAAPKKNENAVPVPPNKGMTKPHSTAAATVNPLWSDLTPAQQQALMPLAAEWDRMDAGRKKKWLVLSSKFASLKPEEQARLHNRMRDWAKLTPEQRRTARESYSRAKKLKPAEKTAEWQHYQQLPEEQKKKLADEAAAKNRVATLPPASQGKGKLTSPPKSTLRREAGATGSKPANGQTPVQPASQRSQALPQTSPQPASQPAVQAAPAVGPNSQ